MLKKDPPCKPKPPIVLDQTRQQKPRLMLPNNSQNYPWLQQPLQPTLSFFLRFPVLVLSCFLLFFFVRLFFLKLLYSFVSSLVPALRPRHTLVLPAPGTAPDAGREVLYSRADRSGSLVDPSNDGPGGRRTIHRVFLPNLSDSSMKS